MRHNLPPAYGGCTCACHRNPGVMHMSPCCGPSTPGIGDGPIEARLATTMNALARGIDDILNGDDCSPEKKQNGFVLLCFPIEGHGGRCNYISNSKREDIVIMLKEQLARLEGQPEVVGHG